MSFNSKYFDRKAGSLEEAILKTVQGEAFKPHMMYDPKTGKGYKADTMDDHLRMKKMGYGHDKPEMKETNKNDKSDDGEGMDAVQPKAVKKKFANRKDKDIDNDGDVDSSDEYLHKRRKAVSKSMSKEETKINEILPAVVGLVAKPLMKKAANTAAKKAAAATEAFEYGTPEATQNSLNMTPGQSTADWNETVSVIQKKNDTMREALAKVWGFEEGHNPFRKEEKVPKGFHRMPDGSLMKDSDMDKKENKTMTGKSMTKVNVDPDIKEKK